MCCCPSEAGGRTQAAGHSRTTAAGVTFPSELCGRTVLYSSRHRAVADRYDAGQVPRENHGTATMGCSSQLLQYSVSQSAMSTS